MKNKITGYFNQDASSFDDIYTGRKSRIMSWLDRRLRWDMQARFEETIRECGEAAGVEILDVGCGSGRYVIALAKMGAIVTGIDGAGRMLDIARRLASESGVENRCTFIDGDFIEASIERRFAITIAVGFFDYIADPAPYLGKMKALTSDKLIATFPRLWTWRAPVRKIRLAVMGCPVRFYTKRGIERLLSGGGWKTEKIRRVGKLYFVVAIRTGVK